MGPGNFLHDNLSVKNDGPKFAVTTMAKGPETRKQHKKHKIINLSYMKTNSLTKWLGLAILPAALAFTSCIEDKIVVDTPTNDPIVDNSNETLQNATYTVGGGDQSRAINLGKWSETASRSSITDFSIEVPAPDDKNYIVASQNDVWQLPNNLSNVNIYITGDVDQFQVNNAGTGNNVYIIDGVTVKWDSQNSGNIANVYNEGSLILGPWSLQSANQIENIYNVGYLEFGQEGQTENIASGHEIYSDGLVVFNGNVTLEATTYIENKLTVNGTLKIQTGSTKKNICEIESSGKVEVTTDLTVGKITAPEIKFDGAKIQLRPNGHVNSPKLILGNSGCLIKAAEGSIGLVDTKDIEADNAKSINDVFGVGVYVNFETIKYYDENIAKNVVTVTADEYKERAGDIATQGGINSGISVEFVCGAEPEPGTEPDPNAPRLDQVADIESPTHDHDKDKTDDHRRHLSATSLTFDGNGYIYASYHMRGGNWGGDTYDKDDIEGCIERWSFDGNEIEIGNWMWTNDFDFNHIILDGNQIVTVGHKGGEGNNGVMTDFGGIIGKLPTDFYNNNWDATDELSRDDFQYKYLTTEVPVYGPSSDEGKEDIIIDYKNAGDGNCVVKVGSQYYVATSAGYGVLNENFKRVKVLPAESKDSVVLFTSTAGSAKYLVENNGTVNVLYLNEKVNGNSTAETSFGATLATMSSTSFPTGAQTETMKANVTPVDGKNVIAVNNGVVYACLSKGGLQVGNEEVITFSNEDGLRSVNGVAVDDKYIYVANGSYITVLDKITKEKVVERKGESKNVSANFVEVNVINGERYVFVAFGQDGIKVYRFANS